MLILALLLSRLVTIDITAGLAIFIIVQFSFLIMTLILYELFQHLTLRHSLYRYSCLWRPRMLKKDHLHLEGCEMVLN